MDKTLAELAQHVGGAVVGDGQVIIERVAPIDEAGAGAITFLANPRYRRHLSEDGMVLVVMGIHQQSGELVSGPDLISRGFMGAEESEEVLEHAKKVVLETLNGMNRESRTDPAEVKEEVRKALRRFFRKKLERHPVVLPYIIET